MLINNSNLLPEHYFCSIEDRGQFLKDFGNINSFYQQEEGSLSRATDLVTEMLLSEETNDIKENSHRQIAHEGIAVEPKVPLNTLSEEEIISTVDKFIDSGNKIQVASLDFKLISSSHAAILYSSFEFVEKTLDSNYNKGKIAAQQQFKFSLNPEFTNLELIGQRFNSKSVFEKDRNNPEECHTSYSIVYHLVVIILKSLPDRIYKNLDNQYHRIIEAYDARQRKGRENILTCDICHGKSFRF